MSLSDQMRDALAPHIEPLKARWDTYSSRDQMVLSVLGGLTLLVVLIFGIWLPSHRAAEHSRQEYQNNQDLLSWMQANADRARANGNGPAGDSSVAVLTVVSNSASANNIPLRRFEPDGERVRIWLDGIAFNKVAGWLNQLSQQGINPISAEVERQGDNSGLVSVQLTLSR